MGGPFDFGRSGPGGWRILLDSGVTPSNTSVGAAPDPLVAREMIRNLNPDVITLDVEMPKMDGLDFLEKLMRLRPMPVVMVSTLTERGSEVTMRALELGAIDFVSKPKIDIASGLKDYTAEITDKIRVAASARIRQHPPAGSASKSSAETVLPALGIILTGMGKDGATGMLEMKQTGSHTIAQDEASCVVFGMPKEAIARGGVDEVVTLNDVAARALAGVRSMGGQANRV